MLIDAWSHGEPSDLVAAIAARHASGGDIIDLITANPHEHGLDFPAELLAEITARALPRIAVYHPDSAGQPPAREGVAAWYRDRGTHVDARDIVLTPGTSLAYFYAFRLLLEGGGEVLVPRPTYPLFDDIARIAGARTRSYHLKREGTRWAFDPEDAKFQITARTRAIVVVSPHNPVGHVFDESEWHALATICREQALALIVDEVFSEFSQSVATAPRAMESRFGFPLVLTLNGISKMLSLPGLKGGWIALGGDRARVEPLRESLAYMSDTFLPVSELTQGMLPELLLAGARVTSALAQEYRARMGALCDALQGGPWEIPDVEGGVYLPLYSERFASPSVIESIVRDVGVVAHHGSMYGVDEPALIMTCVAREEQLREGAARLKKFCAR